MSDALLPLGALLRRRTVALAAFLIAATLVLVHAAGGGPAGARAALILLAPAAALVTVTGSGRPPGGAGWLELQKPGTPSGRALRRLGWGILTAVLAHTAVCLLVQAPRAELGVHALASAWLSGLLLALPVAAAVFAFSGWGVRLDVLPALAVVFYLGLVGEDARVDPSAFGAWSPLLLAFRFPLHEVARFDEALRGGSLPGVLDAVRWGSWTLGAVAVGLLGVTVRPEE